MLHESPRPAACWHVLHLLHILEPYEPNCWQSSEMIPRPGILDDMTPPPRPGITLQVFWHFPARKEPTRFYHHAENFFKLPPAILHDRQKRARIRFCGPTCPYVARQRTSCRRLQLCRARPQASGSMCQDQARPGIAARNSRFFCLGKRLAVKSARRIINAYNHIGRRTNGPRIAS